MVYYKQEKFVLAEFHFKKALTINPYNSTLLCTIAVVSRCCFVINRSSSSSFYLPSVQQYAHLHQYSLEEQDSKVRQEH